MNNEQHVVRGTTHQRQHKPNIFHASFTEASICTVRRVHGKRERKKHISSKNRKLFDHHVPSVVFRIIDFFSFAAGPNRTAKGETVTPFARRRRRQWLAHQQKLTKRTVFRLASLLASFGYSMEKRFSVFLFFSFPLGLVNVVLFCNDKNKLKQILLDDDFVSIRWRKYILFIHFAIALFHFYVYAQRLPSSTYLT